MKGGLQALQNARYLRQQVVVGLAAASLLAAQAEAAVGGLAAVTATHDPAAPHQATRTHMREALLLHCLLNQAHNNNYNRFPLSVRVVAHCDLPVALLPTIAIN